MAAVSLPPTASALPPAKESEASRRCLQPWSVFRCWLLMEGRCFQIAVPHWEIISTERMGEVIRLRLQKKMTSKKRSVLDVLEI